MGSWVPGFLVSGSRTPPSSSVWYCILSLAFTVVGRKSYTFHFMTWKQGMEHQEPTNIQSSVINLGYNIRLFETPKSDGF